MLVHIFYVLSYLNGLKIVKSEVALTGLVLFSAKLNRLGKFPNKNIIFSRKGMSANQVLEEKRSHWGI